MAEAVTEADALAWCMLHRAVVWFSPLGSMGLVVVKVGDERRHGSGQVARKTIAEAVQALRLKIARQDVAAERSSGHEIKRRPADALTEFTLIWYWKGIRNVRPANRESAERFAAKHGIVMP